MRLLPDPDCFQIQIQTDPDPDCIPASERIRTHAFLGLGAFHLGVRLGSACLSFRLLSSSPRGNGFALMKQFEDGAGF